MNCRECSGLVVGSTQLSQGRFDPALLDNPQARQALLDQLVDRKLQIAVATENHFSVSDGALRRAIASSSPTMVLTGTLSSGSLTPGTSTRATAA